MSASLSIENLPGAEIVEQGLVDARAGKLTVFVCLLWIAMPTLHQAGLIPEEVMATPCPEPELALYRLLRNEGGDAFGRYNSLLRRLVSFERALRRRTGD